MTDQGDPMIDDLSQIELFFKFGKDIKVEEKDGKITVSGKFQVAPDATWIETYGSNG